jgi:hypothetical protein
LPGQLSSPSHLLFYSVGEKMAFGHLQTTPNGPSHPPNLGRVLYHQLSFTHGNQACKGVVSGFCLVRRGLSRKASCSSGDRMGQENGTATERNSLKT